MRPHQAGGRHSGYALTPAHSHDLDGRAGVRSRTPLGKVERSDPSVSLRVYATTLFILGLSDQLSGLAEPSTDSFGLQLEEEGRPQRIRRSRKREGSGA